MLRTVPGNKCLVIFSVFLVFFSVIIINNLHIQVTQTLPHIFNLNMTFLLIMDLS